MGLFDKKPPAPKGVSATVTGGRIHAVKCPYCGKANDFRGVGSTGSNLLDNGSEFDCDHCHHIMLVVKVENVTVVSVRQHPQKFNQIPRQK